MNSCCLEQYSEIPIGTAIDNSKLFVLDENLQQVPIGVVGELYVAGDCLSQGYLSSLGESYGESFELINVNDMQFSAFATGDLVKRDEIGNLLILGRKDRQVKINGARINVFEIEQLLNSASMIDQVFIIQSREGLLNAFIKPVSCTMLRLYLCKSQNYLGIFQHICIRVSIILLKMYQ